MINNQQGNICLNNQDPFKWASAAKLPQCSPAEAPKKDTSNVYQQGIDSAAVLSLTKVITGGIVPPKADLNELPHLFCGQFVSRVVRSTINQYTDDSLVRVASHAVVQGLRNRYLDPTPISILNGAIDGAGYSLTSDMADSLKDSEGKGTRSSLAATIAGTYLTEMTEAFVACRAAPTLCSAIKLKAFVAATLLSGYNVYSYATQA